MKLRYSKTIHLLKMKLQSVLLFGNTSIPEKKRSFDNLC
jgi:hypothetical protein